MAERLPLHDLHRRIGAVIDASCGIDLPISYGDPAAEHGAVRSAVGLLDRSYHGVLEVTGRDRATFLQGMLTNDIERLAPGQGCAAAFLDARARVQSLVTVLALDDRLLLIGPGGQAAKLSERLERFHFSERVELRDASPEWALFMLAGPRTAATVERLTSARLPVEEWRHAEATVGGAAVRVARGSGETGAAEAWFLTRREDGPAVFEVVLAAGAAPVGLRAFDVLRVEAGTPWYGHDVDETTLLPEIPAERLVSHTKGCYIGQEIVVRVRDRGHVNRQLSGLVIDGERSPEAGARVVHDGREVGQVTSSVRSFSLGRPIALGFVRRDHAVPGTAVTVIDDGRALTARVAGLPFVPPA